MKETVIKERLGALLTAMKEAGISYYLIPTSDFHNSEYVSPYFGVREYFSNFSGSNGTLVVSEKETGLWTDGRYFIQAENELSGTGILLQRMGEEGVPTILEYLEQHMEPGQTLGFDGRVVDTNFGKSLEEKLVSKGISLKYDRDLAEGIWTDRPALPCGEVKVLSDALCGRSVAEKLEQVNAKVKEAGAAYLLLSKLDDLMWLLNIRGCDVECNPVALSYGFFGAKESYLFVQPEAVSAALEEHAGKHHIQLKDYKDIVPFLQQFPYEGSVLCDAGNMSYLLYQTIAKQTACVEEMNPTELLKAVKNETELSRMEEAYLKDSAALCKFIYWIKKNAGKLELDEYTAGAYLDGLRAKLPGYLELSFPTICAYEENAAMMHYQADAQSAKKITDKGFLLVDSGGQYLGGTTDVTRTIVLGENSPERKKHFTLTAVGMLRLSAANFLYGCTGRNLDILARGPLWDAGIDYKCGTGHGIGYILNVHEGPQGIRWRYAAGVKEAVLEPGMVVSNEPGVYKEGSHGIRTENIMRIEKGEKNGDGQFLHFVTLTYVPIDLEAIDVRYMQPVDIERLNDYHKAVYDKIHGFLEPDEAAWLKEATRALPVGGDAKL